MIKTSYNLDKDTYLSSLKILFKKTQRELVILSLIVLGLMDIWLGLYETSLGNLIIFNILTTLFCLLYIYICQKIFLKNGCRKSKYFFGFGKYELIIDGDKIIERLQSKENIFWHQDIRKILLRNDCLYVYYKDKKKTLTNIIEIIRKDYFKNSNDFELVKELLKNKSKKEIKKF